MFFNRDCPIIEEYEIKFQTVKNLFYKSVIYFKVFSLPITTTRLAGVSRRDGTQAFATFYVNFLRRVSVPAAYQFVIM